MTATVRIYKSTDASAPAFTGQAGSMINLLTACLVTGYGSQTAAGWTKPYTGTNLAAFLMGAGTIGGSAQMYIRVDDTNPQWSIIVGYETMSAVSTGTGLFPTVAQMPTGLYVYKSVTADATARPWVVIACERAFYVFLYGGSSIWGTANSQYDAQFGFGAFVSYKPGDAYNCFIQGGINTNSYSSALGACSAVRVATGIPVTSGYYVARGFAQTGTAINAAKIIPTTSSFLDGSWPFGRAGGFTYPDPVSGTLRGERIITCENDGSGNNYVVQRGYLPGIWAPLHSLPQQPFDTFAGSDNWTGKNFIILHCNCNSATTGYGLFETTGSWDL